MINTHRIETKENIRDDLGKIKDLCRTSIIFNSLLKKTATGLKDMIYHPLPFFLEKFNTLSIIPGFGINSSALLAELSLHSL